MSEEYKGEQYEGDGPNLEADAFIARIVEDPNEPPDLLLLSGYLGASSEEGYVRLYLDEELSRYVEIPQDAVRHRQELPREHSPLGGSYVWIDRQAEVMHGKAGEERRRATFLEGQIAQDYMGGAVGTGGEGGAEAGGAAAADTRLLGCGGGGILRTDMGPGCGHSSYEICVTRTELPGCRTLTGILCTRFGPGCHRTLLEPNCTIFGPNCHTVLVKQCMSVFYPCVTHGIECQASGFVPCNPPVDWTVYEQGGQQQQQAAAFAAAAPGGFGGGGFGGFGGGGVIQTGFNCPSLFDNCATVNDSFCPSRLSFCPTEPILCITQSPACPTSFNSPCPSINVRCPTEFGPRCRSQIVICSDTRTGPGCQVGTVFNCPSAAILCRTRLGPGCLASAVAFCPDTRAGCQVASVACGVDPAGGGGIHAAANIAPGGAEAVALPPTRFCPSRLTICRTQQIVCQTPLCPTIDPRRCIPTWFVICNPTPFCPTQPPGCGQLTQYGHCETFGPCPSAVDACPTRLGCDVTLGGCFPGGGDPAGGGGGPQFGAEAFAAQPMAGNVGAVGAIPQTRACVSQFIRCPSAVDACPTRFNCPSRIVICQSQQIRCQPTQFNVCKTLNGPGCISVNIPCITQDFSCESRGFCPSAVDACPSRWGCFDTQVCGESIACFDPQGGGGFDPRGGGGGFGGGGFGGGGF